MRATRKRFTASRVRHDTRRDRAVKVREGIGSYRNSPAGRAVKAETVAAQWQRQGGVCDRCGERMALGDAKLAEKKFEVGATNRVVHKHACREMPKVTVANEN